MSRIWAARVARRRRVGSRSRAWSAIRALTFLGAIATLGAGCSVGEAVIRGSASPVISGGTPAAAVIYVTGDPVVASRGSSLRMVARGSSEAVDVLAVEAGERIIAQAAAMPGDYTLTGSDGQCSLPVSLVEGWETDVVLKTPSDGPCQIVVAGDHVAGDPPHPWFGAVAVTLAGPSLPSALMVVRSLDNPPNPPPPPVPGDPDSGGRFYVAGLPAGRYEATITSNGELIGARVFEIGAGSEAEISIEVQPQAAP